jgi:hypothetical protein
MQGLMMRLFRYDTKFTWVPGSQLYLADTLSRAFLNNCKDDDPEMRVLSVQIAKIPDQRMEEVRKATISDTECATIIRYIQEGWPDHRYQVSEDVKMYFDVRDTLSYEDGIIYKGERVVIPKDLRSDIMKRLHISHLGIDSMMRRARETVFWPGMARELKELCENCLPCMQNKPNNQKETLIQHEDTQFQWQKIGCDLFIIEGRDFMVVVDYDTNFIEVEAMPTTTSARVITNVKKICARYGIPSQLVSDGGPQFVSQEFKNFTQEWGISHIITSPYHSQSNGKAESAVKAIKGMMRKCIESKTDQWLALLELRNTPRQDGPSPAVRMFGRKLNTNLPVKHTDRDEQYDDRKRARKETVKRHYDNNAKDLSDLKEGESVLFKRDTQAREWLMGKIISRKGDRSYLILSETGGLYQRNRILIRPTLIPFEPKMNGNPVMYDKVKQPTLDPGNPNHDVPSLPPEGENTIHVNGESTPRSNTTVDRPRRPKNMPKRFDNFVLSMPK